MSMAECLKWVSFLYGWTSYMVELFFMVERIIWLSIFYGWRSYMGLIGFIWVNVSYGWIFLYGGMSVWVNVCLNERLYGLTFHMGGCPSGLISIWVILHMGEAPYGWMAIYGWMYMGECFIGECLYWERIY